MNDLGEKQFLSLALPTLAQHPRFLNGFGDDSAIVDIGCQDVVLVTKIDRAAQPMATRRGWTDYEMWGQLAVTTTCSDLLASGATPKAFMLAMILPGDFPVENAEQILRGCASECAKNDVAFVGGDTKEGSDQQLVGSGFGLARRQDVHTRKGAEPGDVVVVAGNVGGYLGSYLPMIEADGVREAHPSWSRWLDYVSRPEAMWAEALFMNANANVKASMDTSDGIYDALATLGGSYGALIDEPAMPYHEHVIAYSSPEGRPTALALSLGVGDWNIIYILERAAWREIEDKAHKLNLRLTAVGEIVEQSGVLVRDREGTVRRLRPVVNEHFVARQEDAGRYFSFLAGSLYTDGENS